MVRYVHSGSFKVIEAGTSRQPKCDFLLLVNNNMDHIFYRFRDIATKAPEIGVFFTNYSHLVPIQRVITANFCTICISLKSTDPPSTRVNHL